MRIAPLPSNFDGSGFYRVLYPARALRRRGHSLVGIPSYSVPVPLGPTGGSTLTHYGLFGVLKGHTRPILLKDLGQVLAESSDNWDVLVMNQREESGWGQLLTDLRSKGNRIVVDSDDDWLHVPTYNPGSKKTDAQRQAMCELLGAADVLTVATPTLAEVYAPYCENTVLIRNRLEWPVWEDVPLAYEQERRRLRVGWMGDARWRKGDLLVLRGVIGPWLAAHPDVEFVAAGDPLVHDILGVPLQQRVSLYGARFKELPDITAVMDIGLVPLVPGIFNECKSHLKGLEYAACGIPCIATPTESYRWWVEPGVNGLLAKKPGHWIAALDAMVENWREMGRNARLKASENTIEGAAGEWESVYLGDHADAAGAVGAAA